MWDGVAAELDIGTAQGVNLKSWFDPGGDGLLLHDHISKRIAECVIFLLEREGRCCLR